MLKMDFDKLFEQIATMKVGVLGDVMLDTYWWGHVERISPEAPVPVVAVSKKEQRIGGAGNVALNIRALGALVSLITVLGDDEDGCQLKKLCEDQQIGTDTFFTSNQRITTNKIRIISRNQHMMRLDAEMIQDIGEEDENKLWERIEHFVTTDKPEVMILEDYNKGILTKNIINRTIALCREKSIPTFVDPKRKNFFEYRHATVFKPNFMEAITSLNLLPEDVSPDLLAGVHGRLHEKLQHDISLITLSEHGIFYGQNHQQQIIASHRRKIADVSGAGDTVIAVASLVYAATKNIELTAEIANIAGGIVCEEVGTVAINRERLLQECKRLLEDVNF
jgi:D-glycero-beta-D-manno-heptose-7-phosphate kinase